MFVSRFCIAVIMLITLAPVMAYSGSLDSPAAPTDTGSAMYTLTDIYNRLDTGTATAKRTGAFTEPTDGPGTATGYTLDEIMAIAPEKDDTDGASASEVLSGRTFWGLTTDGWGTQTGSIAVKDGDNASTAQAAAGGVNYLTAPAGYYDGDDRVSATDAEIAALDDDLVAANIGTDTTIFGVTGTLTPLATCSGTLDGSTRWCDNEDGTVTDLTTGLVWLQDAFWGEGVAFWVDTISGTNAHDRAAQVQNGIPATLSDGSEEGDWRLPTLSELEALTSGAEAVRSGTPRAFGGVQSSGYWSSTTNSGSTATAWGVNLVYGDAYVSNKNGHGYVWPVRAGQ